MKMLKKLKMAIFGTEPKISRQQREIEAYLSNSVDLVDLERRQRELERTGRLW
jgi:hypothetical protein